MIELAKPIIVFIGLDKVGKTVLSQKIAKRLDYTWDNFPSRDFSVIRAIAKTNIATTESMYGFPTTPWTRSLAHALSHNLSYDKYKMMSSDPDIKGLVVDRWWYCARAYNSVIGGVPFNLLMQIEEYKAPHPTIVVLVTSDAILGELETDTDREAPEHRVKIQQAYDAITCQLLLSKVPVIEFLNKKVDNMADSDNIADLLFDRIDLILREKGYK